MLSEAVIVALISGGISLVGIIVSALLTQSKSAYELDKQVSIIKTEISGMKDDIKSHNNYARMFAENVPVIKERIAEADRRIEKLESKV